MAPSLVDSPSNDQTKVVEKKPVLIVATGHEKQDSTPALDEGYDTIYLAPVSEASLLEATGNLSGDTKYGIIALGAAVPIILDFVKNTLPSTGSNLAAVMLYFPPEIPQYPLRKDIPFHFHCIAEAGSNPLASLSVGSGSSQDNVKIYTYTNVKEDFAEPKNNGAIQPLINGLARARTLELLRGTIGPVIDIEAIYDKWVKACIVEGDVDKMMTFMVPEPCFNAVSTCIGGVGNKEVRNHFIHRSFQRYYSPTFKLQPISRTIGVNQIVEEAGCSFIHDRRHDWILPGVEPTGKHCEMIMVTITRFRGPLISEHQMYWDQASLLVQLGLINPEGLPVVGAEAARKVLDKHSVEGNKLLPVE